MTVCRWFLIIFLRNLWVLFFFFNLVQLPKCLAKLDVLEFPNLYIDNSVKERVHLSGHPKVRGHTLACPSAIASRESLIRHVFFPCCRTNKTPNFVEDRRPWAVRTPFPSAWLY